MKQIVKDSHEGKLTSVEAADKIVEVKAEMEALVIQLRKKRLSKN